MILCHEYRFIFLKTAKTAGTSIEIALSKYCGERDVITPISDEDEEIRRAAGYRGPQNYRGTIGDYSFKDFLKLLFKQKIKARFHNHVPAEEARSRIPDDVWHSYYKFCFERNPWDRVLSYYYWHYRNGHRPSMMEFLESDYVFDLKRRGMEVYTIDGDIAVDRVCRYESLEEEIESVRLHLGIPEKLELPNAKSGYRNDKRHYREIFDAKEKVVIERIFGEEIDRFDYAF